MLHLEAQVGSLRYSTWLEFKSAFITKFCLKNKTQMALAKLKTLSYFQGHCTVDDYIDDFQDLIDHAGYMKGLAIVIKFQCGL
jgi:hypothetical protein